MKAFITPNARGLRDKHNLFK